MRVENLILTLTHEPARAVMVLPYTDDRCPGEPKVRTWIVSLSEDLPEKPIAFMLKLLYDDDLDDDPNLTFQEWKEWVKSGGIKYGDVTTFLLPSLNEPKPYDPNHDEGDVCRCGHTYARHFDWDDDYRPGCKYCDCREFEAEPGENH